jgi:hypothetical protein
MPLSVIWGTPVNNVEKCLSSTADHFEECFAGDRAAWLELDTLLKAGQQPHVERVLSDFPDHELLIIVRKMKL